MTHTVITAIIATLLCYWLLPGVSYWLTIMGSIFFASLLAHIIIDAWKRRP